ncbi:alpha/beta hydrolase [Vibrio pomeroyi]|uniref:Alpha/beta hydrolase n=1 Tax=Vibrio pomeroyi TaxID=198832 RepID=A0ABV4N2A3_9VIBR
MKNSLLDNSRYQIIEDFHMPQLGRKRTIRIYLPKNYHNDSRSYPVIYMHDGQNLFESSLSFGGDSWEVPTSVDQFFADDNGAIVVGIENGSEFEGLCRMYEYSPWKIDPDFVLPDWPESVYQSGGEGQQYIDFITDSLKPYIDDNYRTLTDRDNTAIAGSSMGGFISLYGVLQRPDVFSLAGVFSPAFWFNAPEMFNFVESKQLHNPVKIYMDMGTQESSGRGIDFEKIYLDGSNKVSELLRNKANVALQYQVDEGGLHTESAWAKHYPNMLGYLFD